MQRSSFQAVYSRWASLKMFAMGASDVEKAKKQSSLCVLEDLRVAVPKDWSRLKNGCKLLMPAQIRRPGGRFMSFLHLLFPLKSPWYNFKVFWKLA
jgi:hypothetical protein